MIILPIFCVMNIFMYGQGIHRGLNASNWSMLNASNWTEYASYMRLDSALHLKTIKIHKLIDFKVLNKVANLLWKFFLPRVFT